jgi:hypothetical protein
MPPGARRARGSGLGEALINVMDEAVGHLADCSSIVPQSARSLLPLYHLEPEWNDLTVRGT